MAEKEKKNRVMNVLLTEHKWENLILAILAVFAIELGVLLLTKNYLTIPANAFLIGKYWKVFAWILIILGAVSLILSVSSFYVPSIAEIKNITGVKKKTFFANVLEVFVFSLVLAIFFSVCDLVIEVIIKAISK